MKKLFVFAVVGIALLLSTTSLVEAKRGRGGSESEVRIDNEVENEVEDEIEQRIRIRDDNRFDIRGTVNSVSGNSVVIAGQTVVLDQTQVRRLRQRGTLVAGRMARAKGIVQNGTLFAEEVRAINVIM